MKITRVEKPIKTKRRCVSSHHWTDIIVFGGCAGCGLSEKMEEKKDRIVENEIEQTLLEDHDCHASPEDGCGVCHKAGQSV